MEPNTVETPACPACGRPDFQGWCDTCGNQQSSVGATRAREREMVALAIEAAEIPAWFNKRQSAALRAKFARIARHGR